MSNIDFHIREHLARFTRLACKVQSLYAVGKDIEVDDVPVWTMDYGVEGRLNGTQEEDN